MRISYRTSRIIHEISKEGPERRGIGKFELSAGLLDSGILDCPSRFVLLNKLGDSEIERQRRVSFAHALVATLLGKQNN